MADLRIIDMQLLTQAQINGSVKLPTGGEGNYSIQLSDLAWYVANKENLTNVAYVDSQDDLKANKATTLAGYGITDAASETHEHNQYFAKNGGEITGTKIQVKGTIPSKYYKMEGTFEVVNEDGSTEIKSIKFSKAKAQPNADLTISAQEISDFSLTWDILVDDQDLILEIDKKVG